MDNISNIYLYEDGLLKADLMSGSYDFSTEAGTFDSRFNLLIVMKQESPTDIPFVLYGSNQQEAAVKMLQGQQITILRNGNKYDIMGRMSK